MERLQFYYDYDASLGEYLRYGFIVYAVYLHTYLFSLI